MMDIKNFTNGGAPRGVIRSEKLEYHKNSTHSKIKFYIIFIFFSMMDIKIFTHEGGEGQEGGPGAG